MQTILNSVQINSSVAAAEGWGVTVVANCIRQLVLEEKGCIEAAMEKLDQQLRCAAGSDYEQVKNLYPSQFGDEPWEQECADIIAAQMDLWDEGYHYSPCPFEVAYLLGVDPSSSLISCVDQLYRKLSFWGENIVGRD